MRLKWTLLLILLLGVHLLPAQNIEYGAGVDTNYMMIGDQQHFTFKVKSDPGIKISFPQLKDTIIRGVEIISGPVRDSVKESDGRWLIQEKYVITAFDTGLYVIPAMMITVGNDNYNNVLRTEQIGFVVNTCVIDEQQGNKDIVMPYETPWNLAEVLPYILWSLLGIAVIVVSIWYIIRLRKNRPLFVAKKEKIPPYVKAIQSLDEIKAGKLWQSGKEKEYYTKLTDTVRQYLDDEFSIPAMEQTSFETVRLLEGCRVVENHDKDRVAEMLQIADYVKFAKVTPLQDENARYLDSAYEFLNNTNQRLVKEEELKKVEEEEQKKKSEKEQEKTGEEPGTSEGN